VVNGTLGSDEGSGLIGARPCARLAAFASAS